MLRAPLGQLVDINPRRPREIPDHQLVSFISMAAIDDAGGVYIEEERSFLDVKNGYSPFDSGDILLAKITPCLENGKAVLLNGLKHKFGFGSTEFHVLRPGPNVDARYLFFMIWNPIFRRDAERNMTGTAGQKRVPVGFLARYEVPVPPLIEQRRIAAILDRADDIRRKRRQALAETSVLPGAVFFDMFGDPVASPSSYDAVPLERFIHPDRPITYGILMPGPDLPEGVPYVRVVDMQAGRILADRVRRTSADIDREYRRSRLRAGDILLSIRGNVGRTAVVPDELDGANITQDTARLAARSEADGIFLRGCIETLGMQRLMGRLTKGGAVKGINLGDVRKLPVPQPPAEDRARFADICRNIERLNRGQRDALTASDDLFASLSRRAFRGELR